MRALVVEHIAAEGTGALGEWLTAAGLDLDTHAVWRDGPPPAALPDGYDALVVMGGSMSVHDLHPDEVTLARTCAKPYLGICLGAQLHAHARGGTVTTGRVGPEVGAGRVYASPAAAADPLLAGLPGIADVVQWHWDEVLALPPGATVLAGSPAYPHQAFRVGDRAWGLQFHPEARPSVTARWAAQDAAVLRAAGLDPAAVAAGAAAAWPEVERTWAPVAARFAAVVAGAPSPPVEHSA